MREAPTEPFETAEEARFWTMAALAARAAGARAPGMPVPRPCEPDDVVKCLDRLFRARRIDLHDARILRVYGERGMAPSAVDLRERSDRGVWERVMGRLEPALAARGIVRAPQPTRKAVA